MGCGQFAPVLSVLATLIFIITVVSIADMFWGLRSMTRLSSVKPSGEEGGTLPLVSLIVPACNEEDNIEQAMRTLLRQEYEHLEIIAVNDRSTDKTGAILERLGEENRQKLKIFHVEHLPDGWMGKAHALNYGADQAKGDYLLFTDGDIQMESSTIARAVRHMLVKRRDHISLLFKNTSPGWLLNSLILDTGTGLLQVFRPWLAHKEKSWNFMGVGAFNLVKKEVYLAIDGHRSIKMHPIDDIMLGKIIKRNGFEQECLVGYDLVVVPWYAGVGSMVDGLMKNVLALINYRFYLLPFMLATMFFLNILPFWGMLLADGTAKTLFAMTMLVKLTAFYAGTRMLAISPWCTLGTIVSPYVAFFIVVKATWLNLRDKGIFWRGTYYPLKELQKNEPLLF